MQFFLLLLTFFSGAVYAAEKPDIGPRKPTCVLIENGPSSPATDALKEEYKEWKPIQGKKKNGIKAHFLRLKKNEMDALRTTLTESDILATIADDAACTKNNTIIHTQDFPLEITINENTRLFTVYSKNVYSELSNPSQRGSEMETALQKAIGNRIVQRIIMPNGRSQEILLVDGLADAEAIFIGAMLKRKYKKPKSAHKTKTVDSKKKKDFIIENLHKLLKSIDSTQKK